MFRNRGRSIVLLLLIYFSGSAVNILNGQEKEDWPGKNWPETELGETGGPAPDGLERAFAILEERGELVLEFHSDDQSTVNKIGKFLSLDRRTAGGFEAYASAEGFRRFLDYDIPYRIIERQNGKKSLNDTAVFPGDWDVYPSHYQYINFMKSVALDYPEICRLDTIGKSADGRSILVMKITDKPDEHEPEPAFVYSSTMHGDETAGYVILLRLIGHLCSNYGEDSLVTELVNGLEIWINPLANPDGTYWQGDSAIYLPKRFNSNNADLNRNFPGIQGDDHPDNLPRQPENMAQMDFLSRIYMVMGVNIHDGKELINYPFDTWPDLHADDAWFIRTSKEYAKTARERAFPVLYMLDLDSGITNGWEWYKAVGTRQDWVTYSNHAREVTLEISRDKNPPAENLPYLWHYNHPSLLRYMQHSLFGIHGIIRDESTGNPLKASIRVPGHDKLNSDICSDSLSGYFARLIEPGTWNLEISAGGYAPRIINDVQVISDQATWLDVSLQELSLGLDDMHVVDVSPNPFHGRTEMTINLNTPGPCKLFLYDLNGRLVHEDHFYCPVPGRMVRPLDCRHLEPGIYILKMQSGAGSITRKILKQQ